MTSTPSDDVDALFDLPPLPPAAEPGADALAALAAEEAALAAELAADLKSGDVAADAPESRAALRVQVSWLARMQLPDGQVIELRVRNVSETGVGLLGDDRIPADTRVNFEMDVPSIDGRDGLLIAKGTIRTTYKVGHGSEILCGGTWQAPPAGIERVKRWIEALRR